MLEVILYIAYIAIAVLLSTMGYQLSRSYKRFKAPSRKSDLGREVDLPSVTVCIPARNEQHALTDCLQRVVASKYDKLEIIVLDDVSGDDTSALIKSFAAEGVRFVKGKSLPEGWLGKNHALQGLLKEASGTYVLFMDVDTRLAPDAIENMVRHAVSHGLAMLSVLPRREDGWRFSVVVSPLRYFWELLFHRRLWPATASNAWLIRRKVLEDRFEGFKAFKNAIQPESKIATELASTHDYHFIIGTENFGVAYEKKWRSQLITSVRLLYPLLYKDAALAILALIDLTLLVLPFVVLLSLFVVPFGLIHLFAAVLAVASYVLYATYAKKVWAKGWVVGVLLWPVLLVQEMILICASIFQYTRKTVQWKGRLIRPGAQN